MIVISDVHERDFWKEAVKQKFEKEKIIFLGDYTDPYPDEGISKDAVIDSIKSILGLKNLTLKILYFS